MTDKERILTYILQRAFMNNLFPKETTFELFEKVKEENLKVGDIVLCSSYRIHDWTIGVLIEKGKGFFDKPWIVKDITSDRLCNITNETFYKIPFKIPDYILLYGAEREIYIKCIKAIDNADYNLRYKNITFDNKICKLELRQSFSNETKKTIEFKHNTKTTIKSILRLIEKEVTKCQETI